MLSGMPLAGPQKSWLLISHSSAEPEIENLHISPAFIPVDTLGPSFALFMSDARIREARGDNDETDVSEARGQGYRRLGEAGGRECRGYRARPEGRGLAAAAGPGRHRPRRPRYQGLARADRPRLHR